jgi:hypothetical protein
MHPNFVGALLNSALYLVSVFVAGLMTGHKFAWQCAVVAMGVTYLSHVAQLVELTPRVLTADRLIMFSVALGIAAGLALLV